ncbi:MAG TPA: sigma-70 family RNA polymerase sigma factor [Candidatus Tumulicola sp.]|jgi:RNA polymerase sigma-70 factor (ECF subfamily)
MRLDVVEAARTGDAQQREALIREMWPHAFRIALTVVHDRALAEDAAQEACAIVYARVGGLRESAAFAVWFYRIVVREALQVRRTAERAWDYVERDVESHGVERSIVRLDVAAALAKLSPVQRTATVLHYYAGLSGAEVARVLGIPHGSVRFHLFQSRKRLERLLDDRTAGTALERLLLDAV